ncbi:hypothetical protein BDR07DRAFT_1238738, partial [Suillus spraguei]
DTLQTVFNMLGLSPLYPWRLSYEPNKFVPSLHLAKSSPMTASMCDAQGPDPPATFTEPPHPFPNMTIYCFMMWMNSGSHQKSWTEVMHLVKNVSQAEDFDAKDLDGFLVRKCLHALDNDNSQETINFPDDWVETEVNLDIPTKSKDDLSISFSVPGFHYRLLVAVICAAFANVQANTFHLLPFKHLWKDPLDGHEE